MQSQRRWKEEEGRTNECENHGRKPRLRHRRNFCLCGTIWSKRQERGKDKNHPTSSHSDIQSLAIRAKS
eukprot:2549074-Pyramimonas_sp.AAC.1